MTQKVKLPGGSGGGDGRGGGRLAGPRTPGFKIKTERQERLKQMSQGLSSRIIHYKASAGTLLYLAPVSAVALRIFFCIIWKDVRDMLLIFHGFKHIIVLMRWRSRWKKHVGRLLSIYNKHNPQAVCLTLQIIMGWRSSDRMIGFKRLRHSNYG